MVVRRAAGIHLPCRKDHEHTPACHVYGFHSFGYTNATYNFGRVPDRAYDVFLPEALKKKAWSAD